MPLCPLPYTGEIGVPPYFARRLSFPERVTPFNVERLRAAVIAGPDNHPGAVAVEDSSTGRMFNLSMYDLQASHVGGRTLANFDHMLR